MQGTTDLSFVPRSFCLWDMADAKVLLGCRASPGLLDTAWVRGAGSRRLADLLRNQEVNTVDATLALGDPAAGIWVCFHCLILHI